MTQPRQPASAPARARSGLSSSERVYRDLRERIVDGSLAPGTRLVELQVAGELGVSRTPVREALKRLMAEAFVSRDEFGGLIVHTPSPGEVEEAYPLREVLDGLAARLAAYRLSPEEQVKLDVIHKAFSGAVRKKRMDDVVIANIAFHDAIYEASRNRRLVAMAQELSEFVRRFSTAAYASPERAREIVAEHGAILRALETQDPDAAEAAARHHMRQSHIYAMGLRARGQLAPRQG
jgi:DNA-binding GntR family transcriptional regulator